MENSFTELNFHILCPFFMSHVSIITRLMCTVYDLGLYVQSQGHRLLSNGKSVYGAELSHLSDFNTTWHKCSPEQDHATYMIQVSLSCQIEY